MVNTTRMELGNVRNGKKSVMQVSGTMKVPNRKMQHVNHVHKVVSTGGRLVLMTGLVMQTNVWVIQINLVVQVVLVKCLVIVKRTPNACCVIHCKDNSTMERPINHAKILQKHAIQVPSGSQHMPGTIMKCPHAKKVGPILRAQKANNWTARLCPNLV